MRYGALHYLMILSVNSMTLQYADDQAPLSMDGKPCVPSMQQRPCNRIPGDSPVCYVGDPRNDILTIQQLDMIPNPLVMQVLAQSSFNIYDR